MKLALRSAAWGLAITGLTMMVSYDFCLNGDARGLPFAFYCPPCEAFFALDSGNHVIDLARLLGDVVLWGGIAAGIQSRIQSRCVRPSF